MISSYRVYSAMGRLTSITVDANSDQEAIANAKAKGVQNPMVERILSQKERQQKQYDEEARIWEQMNGRRS